MALLYACLIRIYVILLCLTPCRSNIQSPACSLKFTDDLDDFQYFQDGDVIIGGVFTVRSSEYNIKKPEEKIYTPYRRNILSLLTFLSVTDYINQNTTTFSNKTLGFHLYDSWLEPWKAVQSVLKILSGPGRTIPNYSCTGHSKLAGVIGDHYSTTTIPIAQILGLYRYTQISYGTTDFSLSDRWLYPHFFRTVQNDHVHYLAITKIVKHCGWNWVGIFLSDDDAGEKEAQILARYLTIHEICVAFYHRMTMNSAKINEWKDTISTHPCNVTLLCGSVKRNHLSYLAKYSTYKESVMIIIPPSWSHDDFCKLLSSFRFLTILALEPDFSAFQQYKFGDKVLSKHSLTDPLFNYLTVTLYNTTSTENGKNICFQNVTISGQLSREVKILQAMMKYKVYTKSLQVYLAVAVMLEAIDFYKFNHNFSKKRFNQLHTYIKQIKNPFKNVNRKTFFDKNGEFPFYYRITNWVTSRRKSSYNTVGMFTPWNKEEDQLDFNTTLLTWNDDDNKMITSRCSEVCLPGYRKKPGSSIHPCCHDCVKCSEGEISNKTDSENCIKCRDDEWPNEKKDRCIPKLLEFLSYTDVIAITYIAVSALLCIVTGLVMIIFLYYINTPIAKANNRNLSFVLLVSILLSFLCIFLFLGHPNDITCILRVMTFGVLFSIAVSSLIAKTIMVYIAFRATKPDSYWRKWIGSKLSNFIVSVCSSVQVIICLVWLSSSRPFMEMNIHSYQDKIIIECNEGSAFGFYSVLGFMGLLAVISFVLAYMVRTLPDSFNEAKNITFSMLVFCSVWIAMIPAYLNTRGKDTVAVEVFAILASSVGLLSCVFFPKCFIILFKPELNTQMCLLDKKKMCG